MFDVWFGRINLAQIALIVSTVIILPLQLLLCFRVKSRILRLMPAILLTAISIVWLILLAQNAPGIAGVVYLIFAAYTGFMLSCCGIGWSIWAIVTVVKKKMASR